MIGWLKRNWWVVLKVALWIALAIYIRESVRAMRVERWPIGGEIFPYAFCWAMAGLSAFGERGRR